MIYTLVTKNRFGEITNVISFSAVTDYSKSLTATITKNPVENGMQISDGVIVEQPSFDLSVIISKYDIFADNREMIWDGNDFRLADQSTTTDETKPIEQQLEDLMLSAEVFSLLVSENNDRSSVPATRYENLAKSKTREYNNCVIASYKEDDNAGVKDVVFLKLTIQQLNIAYVRKDDLSKDEIQPSLQKVPRKGSNSGSTSSTSTTDSTDTSKLGLENEDAAKMEEAKKTFVDDSEAKLDLKNAQNEKERLLYKKQAHEKALALASQGYNMAEVVETPNGYTVKK